MRDEVNEPLGRAPRAPSRVAALAKGPGYEAQVERLLAGETDPYRAAEELLAES